MKKSWKNHQKTLKKSWKNHEQIMKKSWKNRWKSFKNHWKIRKKRASRCSQKLIFQKTTFQRTKERQRHSFWLDAFPPNSHGTRSHPTPNFLCLFLIYWRFFVDLLLIFWVARGEAPKRGGEAAELAGKAVSFLHRIPYIFQKTTFQRTKKRQRQSYH